MRIKFISKFNKVQLINTKNFTLISNFSWDKKSYDMDIFSFKSAIRMIPFVFIFTDNAHMGENVAFT